MNSAIRSEVKLTVTVTGILEVKQYVNITFKKERNSPVNEPLSTKLIQITNLIVLLFNLKTEMLKTNNQGFVLNLGLKQYLLQEVELNNYL